MKNIPYLLRFQAVVVILLCLSTGSFTTVTFICRKAELGSLTGAAVSLITPPAKGTCADPVTRAHMHSVLRPTPLKLLSWSLVNWEEAHFR